MNARLFWILAGLGAATAIISSATSEDARYSKPLSWKRDHLARTFALGYTDMGANGRGFTEVQTIGTQSCLAGTTVGFDVDDSYAFDIDEPVDLTLTYIPEQTTAQSLVVLFDRSGADGRGSVEVAPVKTGSSERVTLKLERARFAGQGAQGTDIAVAARQGTMAICDVQISRSGSTKPAAPAGSFKLEIVDAVSGRPVAARVGLYDENGRLPLPSTQAVPINRFTDPMRRVWMNRRTAWPVESHEAFYVTGNYEARLPAGVYDLVVARGPEYRIHHQKITMKPGESTTVGVTMRRYDDLPTRGWFSGESHLHLKRDRVADANVWNVVSAEDLHIAHLLEMGNIMGTYFKQPAWGTRGRYERDGVALISGQEDPRTVMRGHTIHWNVGTHQHFNSEGFFQYHLVFERTRREGAMTGYAHLGESFNGRRGLAIDVPFGLVDFIEVLQGGRINTDVWYSFLNLGFKVLPVAGADWPYFGPTLPGVERTFVKVDGNFNIDSWLEGFHKGHAYVSNGPFLEFSVNGHQMGEELRVPKGTKLEITASAQLNPDVDALDRLEIVELGDVRAKEAAAGKDRVKLATTLTADHSMWIAARAYGAHQEPQFTTVAHSAPIYVIVDDEPTWKREAVPQLVALQRQQLNDMLTVPINADGDLEAFETRETIIEQWEKQRPTLAPRIHEADARYQKLLDRAQQISLAKVPVEFLASVRCGPAVREQLASWHVRGDVFPEAGDRPGTRSWKLPTAQLGVWAVVSVDRDFDPALARVEALETRRVTFDSACNALTEVAPHTPSPAASRDFDDKALAALLAREQAGVICVWSPHMPLSADGCKVAGRAAFALGVETTTLLDSNADVSYARETASTAGLPSDALQRLQSVELSFRQATIHAPSILIYKDGRIVGSAVPGYRDGATYQRIIQQRLEAQESQ